MVLPGLVVLFGLATVTLYRYLARRPNPRALWQSTVAIGIVVGIARAVLAGLGWYVVEHTGGPLQIPAFALAMLALPEAAVFGRHRGPVPPALYVSLGLLLTLTSLLFVSVVALVVRVGQGGAWIRRR